MIYKFSVIDMSGEEVNLSHYKGSVLLVVNIASKCSFTPQLGMLENIYQEFKYRDFEILGFPCNQFGSQTPEPTQEFGEFCAKKYNVTFPIFEKVDVRGKDASPLFKFLQDQTRGVCGDKIKWNFTKFLISRDGTEILRFAPSTHPFKLRPDIEDFVEKEK
ncbi:MAG: glutathione peroxidase [Epulopiscium sp. Nele67-Bin005]|nr:MAG: glutathione peroxidase [Epulopiscium sp. Nele67-Bin005]